MEAWLYTFRFCACIMYNFSSSSSRSVLNDEATYVEAWMGVYLSRSRYSRDKAIYNARERNRYFVLTKYFTMRGSSRSSLESSCEARSLCVRGVRGRVSDVELGVGYDITIAVQA